MAEDNKQKNNRRRGGFPRGEREKPEFDHKIIDIRRVTRVVKGGRRFSFSVVVAMGNRKGQVGVGVGKAADISLAIEKALQHGKKNMLIVPLNKNQSIAHEVKAKWSGSRVVIRPTRGQAVIAGSAVRVVLNMAGVKGVSAKIISKSKNRLNNARVAMVALGQVNP